MTSTGIRARIEGMQGSFTPTEKRIVELLLGSPEAVRELSIAALAGQAGVSEASIVRLARKLKLKGYPELRLALAHDAGRRSLSQLHEDVTDGDEAAQILQKVVAATHTTLDDTAAVIDRTALVTAVNELRQARTINFIGIGASGVVAQDAQWRFLKAGFACWSLTDSGSALSRTAALGPGDTVVAISHSGRTREVVLAAEEARRRGAFVVGITQFGQQPLVAHCDVALFTSSRETAFRSEAMASRIAQLVIVDSLFVAVAMSRYEEVSDRLDAARSASASLRES